MNEPELNNEAGINDESFLTNAPEDVIEEKMEDLFSIGLDDVESLKKVLEADGWECGTIKRKMPV